MLTIVYYFEFYISVKKTRVWFSFLERRKYSSTNHYLVEKTPQQVAHPLLASWAADVDLVISLWLVDTNCFPDKSCLHHCFSVTLWFLSCWPARWVGQQHPCRMCGFTRIQLWYVFMGCVFVNAVHFPILPTCLLMLCFVFQAGFAGSCHCFP